jgi:hypothetical protein
MKKFNFGKVFALLVAIAVFAFAFAGCEDVNGAVKSAAGAPNDQEQDGKEEQGGIDDNPGDDGNSGGSLGGSQNMTADIKYKPTNSDVALNAWTGAGNAAQAWHINWPNDGAAYFAVERKPEQTIIVDGEDSALVTKADSGSAVDGITSGAKKNGNGEDVFWEVFTVNACKIDTTNRIDTKFGGGEFAFTLNVTEAGKNPLAVGVTVTVPPENLTGTAVFTVADDGTLTRVQGIKHYTYSLDADNFDTFTEGTDPANCLLDALIWADKNANDNYEYLIRVEKDETLPLVQLTANEKTNVTFRLRGFGSERRISHNKDWINTSANNAAWYSQKRENGITGFLNVGIKGNNTKLYNTVLQIEDNITLQGRNLTANDSYRCMVYVTSLGSKFVMKNGSRITGHNVVGSLSDCAVIYTHAKNSNETYLGYFRMDGGEISSNTIDSSYNNVAIIYVVSSDKKAVGTFIKTGRRIINNMPRNNVHIGSGAQIKLEFTNDNQTQQYNLPPDSQQ